MNFKVMLKNFPIFPDFPDFLKVGIFLVTKIPDLGIPLDSKNYGNYGKKNCRSDTSYNDKVGNDFLR